MSANAKKFIDDLKKNGKRLTWPQYRNKYFPGMSEDTPRRTAERNGIVLKPAKPAAPKVIYIKDNSAPAMTPQEKALLDRVKKDGKWASSPVMTEACNPGHANGDWAMDVLKKYNYVTKPKVPTAQTIIEDRKAQGEINELREQNRELANQLSGMQIALERYANLSGYDPKKFAIPAPSNSNSHEATAILQVSDWHVEEPVIASTVNGMNAYDLSVAKARASKLFENFLKVVYTQRAGVSIKDAILHLGGDFITGYIHPEGEQENLLSPIDACKYAIDLLISGIEYLLKHGEFSAIRCVCSRGNHGRTTMKNQSNDAFNNYEVFIYYFLMNYFKNDMRVIFKADESAYSYVSVYGKMLRFFHGHQIRFAGGVGGLTVPAVKLILRLDASMPAFYSFCGDKHTLFQATPRLQVNGSLIGYNTYAAEKGFEYEPPRQAFSLLDSQYGITMKCPIFVE